MDKKTTQFNIVHGDNEYEIPEECEAAEEAAEELAKTNLEEHYSFINLLSIAVIMLFACIFFISVSGSDIVEDNNLSLTFKTFFSGDYTQALEDSYNNSIPFPDAMKAVEERISLIYGIGNKVTDPIKKRLTILILTTTASIIRLIMTVMILTKMLSPPLQNRRTVK